jgi:hypothetical protein
MRDLRWHWRNCRSIGFSLHFWIWPWAFGAFRSEDVYGGERGFMAGPFGAHIHYSIGNCSSYGLDRFTALSENEAVERASVFEGGGNA